MRALAAALALAALAACGIKGPPRPVDTAVPQPVEQSSAPDAGCCKDRAP